jgi:hypothetical protein
MPRSRVLTISIAVLPLLFVSATSTSAFAQHEPQVRILGEQDLVDMLGGSCIQSMRNCDPALSNQEIRQVLRKLD